MADLDLPCLAIVFPMKNLLAVLYFILTAVQNNTAQSGFNHSYDFDLSFSQLKTILVDNDTIVFVGDSPAIDSPYTQSALIGRIDTIGNVLAYNAIKDPLGDYLSVGENIIKTKDGNYAFHSAILFRNSDAMYKFDKALSLKSVYEFPDTVNLSVFYKGFIEIENGYLLSGYVQRPDHKYDAFSRKLDTLGNTIWMKLYGSPTQSEFVFGMSPLTDTTFILCGGEGTSLTDPDEFRSRVWIIDSSGTILKTWYSPDSLKAMGITEARPVANGGIITFSQTFLGYNAWDDYKLQPTLIKFGDELNVEWIKRFGPDHSSFSYWEDIRATPDGNFIGVGKVAPYNLADLNAHLYGWLYKFTPEGDSIWARADLSEVPYESGIDDNVFGGVGFLSSGSVVAGGNSYINGHIYGWIIKVTPDGCIDTLYCQPSAVRPEPEVRKMKIYPNPADGEVSIDCTGLPEGTVLTVTAVADGRQAGLQTRVASPQVRLNTSQFAEGLYVLTALMPTGIVAREKLLVLHR